MYRLNWRKAGLLTAVALLLSAGSTLPARCQNATARKQLLLAVSPNADVESLKSKLKELGADEIYSSGAGKIFTLVKFSVAADNVVQIKQSLSQDATFGVQENFIATMSGAATSVKDPAFLKASTPRGLTVNDPWYPAQWNLAYMNIPHAWTLRGNLAGCPIALLDGPVAIPVVGKGLSELQYRVAVDAMPLGMNGVYTFAGAEKIDGNHGTQLASIMVAQTNNRLGIAGAVQPAINSFYGGSYVKPYRVAEFRTTSDWDIILGLGQLVDQIEKPYPIKVALIGLNPQANTTFLSHAIVANLMKKYYEKGGLIFAPAGDQGIALPGGLEPSLILVSAVNRSGKLLANNVVKSNYGGPVWFAAPGDAILAVHGDGNKAQVSGTGAAAAMMAAVASLVWSHVPRLTNAELLSSLKHSTPSGGQISSRLGYGVPDAYKALISIPYTPAKVIAAPRVEEAPVIRQSAPAVREPAPVR